MNAYKLSGHQHVCEIERELGILAGRDMKVTFTAQAVPLCRGIMSTLYGSLEKSISEQSLKDLETIVEQMEKGDLSLEEALASFERGVALTRACQQALAEAEQKVKILAAGDELTDFTDHKESDSDDV